MEIISLMGSHAFRLWAVQFVVLLFLAGGLLMLAVGLGLVFNSPATLRFFTAMNRWVSLRRVLRPAEIPRDTRHGVHKYRYWLATMFILGGLFSVYGLATRYNAGAVIFVFGLDILRPAFAGWLVDSARWLLIVGNLVGIAVGILLALFPDRLIALEARGSRWYSERQLAKGADAMNLALDKWVAAHPRAAGWTITLFAALLIAAFGLMLPGIR